MNKSPAIFPYRDMQLLYKKAGIENASVHSLRHTFISFVLQAGYTREQVQNWAGHSDPKVTMGYEYLEETSRGELDKLTFEETDN